MYYLPFEKINSFNPLFNSMNGEDFWASVGTTLSAIGATIFAVLSIPLVSSLFTFLVGAFVTFLVQSKLQNRSEKRKLRVKAIEELHIPLYLKFEEIKEKLLLNLEEANVGSWNPLFDKPQMFTLEHDFKEQILDFYNEADKLEEKFRGIKGTAVDIIFKNVENLLVPVLKEKGLIEIPKEANGLRVEKGADSIGLSLRLRRAYWAADAPLVTCALLNRDPIIYLETNHRTFKMDKMLLLISVNYHFGGNYRTEYSKIDVIEHQSLFRDFWKQLTDELSNNPDINKFNEMRQELIPVCDDLLNRLKKHIETYVKTERI